MVVESERLTDDDDVSEDAAAAYGRTVPAVVSELRLALDGAETDALADGHHGVGRRPAHVPLTLGQPWDAAADDVRPQRHHARHAPATATTTAAVSPGPRKRADWWCILMQSDGTAITSLRIEIGPLINADRHHHGNFHLVRSTTSYSITQTSPLLPSPSPSRHN